MKKLALIAALLLASPVAAQSPQQPLGAGGQTNTSQLPNTGVICQEEIAATFCNVPTSPSHGGYGSSRAGRGRAAGRSSTPSIPPCSDSRRPTNCATDRYCGRASMVGASNRWLGQGFRLLDMDGLACVSDGGRVNVACTNLHPVSPLTVAIPGQPRRDCFH